MAFQNYIATGFLEDCEELIHTLTEQHEKVDWQKFCACWKEMEFDKMFYGRQSSPEVVEFTEEVLQVARLYLVTETDNFESQVVGLFIAYAITIIQPYKNLCSLRLVPNDVPALKKIEAMARRDNRRDILVILGKMYICGKVQFHVCERERAMDISLRKYFDGSTHVPTTIARRWRGRLDRGRVRALDNIAQAEQQYLELKMKAKMVAEQAFPGTNVQLDTFKPGAKRMADSLRKLISGEGVRQEVDCESHMSNVKQRAMKKTVNSMRHLNSVIDRKPKETPASPKPSTSKAKTKRNKNNKLLSPIFSPKHKSNDEPRDEPSAFSLPSLDEPDPALDRKGSPEPPFKGFTVEEIESSDYKTMGTPKQKGKGKGKTSNSQLDIKAKSGHNGKRKINFNDIDKKRRKPKNKFNKKLRLTNDFNSDDTPDSDEEPKEREKESLTDGDKQTKEITDIDKLTEEETCKGKELTIQSKGVVKHFVEYEISDIVIRTERDALNKDIEIEYIDNYTGANAYEEICELSDEDEKKDRKDRTKTNNTTSHSEDQFDELGETNDDNIEIFDVVSERSSNSGISRKRNIVQRYNEEVDDTMHMILSKTTQGVERRTLKQPNLRSKFKRLGILPVANFENEK